MPEPWRVVESRVTYEDRWLKVRSDHCVTTLGRVVAPYHVLEYPTWVNVVALTDEGQVVLIQEYRHGAGRVMLGLPSGTMDPADPDPVITARRELVEETGFEAGPMFCLGKHLANPANQTNLSCLYLAVGARATGQRQLDPTEEIEVFLDDFVGVVNRLWRHELELQLSHAAAIQASALALIRGQVQGPPGVPDALRRCLLGEE